MFALKTNKQKKPTNLSPVSHSPWHESQFWVVWKTTLPSPTNGLWGLIWRGFIAGAQFLVGSLAKQFPYLKGHLFGGRLSSVRKGKEGRGMAQSSQADLVKSTRFQWCGWGQLPCAASPFQRVGGGHGRGTGPCGHWGQGPSSISQTKGSTVLLGQDSFCPFLCTERMIIWALNTETVRTGQMKA